MTTCGNHTLAPAFDAWNANQLYLDGAGNYRLKNKGTSRGPIAPWNKDIKRLFPNDVDGFHRTAGLLLPR